MHRSNMGSIGKVPFKAFFSIYGHSVFYSSEEINLLLCKTFPHLTAFSGGNVMKILLTIFTAWLKNRHLCRNEQPALSYALPRKKILEVLVGSAHQFL